MKHAAIFIGICLSAVLCAATNAAPAPAVKTAVLPVDESRIVSGDSAVVVTEKDFQRSGVRTVAQALATVPGVYVLSRGGLAGSASVTLRGASANSVKVLLNGAELSSAANANLSADIAYMPIDGIEKIEVIFGPQSARFGTGANGGVINIIMKRGTGQSAELTAMGGMHDMWKVRAGMLFGSERFDFSLNAMQMNAHGFSAAAPTNGSGENDGINNSVVAARLGFNPIGDVRFGFDMYYSDTACSVDDGAYADDTDRTRTAKNVSGRFSYSQTLTSWWKHKALFQFSFSDIFDTDAISSNDIYYTEARYRTGYQCSQWQSIFTFQDIDTLLFTLDVLPKNMFLDVKTNDAMGNSVISNSNNDDNEYGSSGMWGAAGIENCLILNNSVYLTAVARMEWGSGGGTEFIMDVTYRISALIKAQAVGLEARASAGNGKTLPAMSFGNYSMTAKNESILGVDAGIRESMLGTILVIDVSGFYNRITNMIIYNGIGSSMNIAQAAK
ncbi:MAG: TonB-dependent receptor plug domain-containing protein [Spirochaetes bacterium]|nr:TonB-dependent receptor plug domain-containing protein [Spirochaetota bacterium]